MKVYSPSQTKSFLECPMAWYLSRKGWTPKTYNKGTLYAIRGIAVSAGLDWFNRHGNTDTITATILRTVDNEWQRYAIDRREWAGFKDVPLTRNDLIVQAGHLVAAYIANVPLAYKVLHSEYVFPNHGNARADVIGRCNGRIIPIDYKCKDEPVQEFYRFQIKKEYQFDWQLMHYCWAVSETFAVDCLDFGIVLLWFGKRPKIEYVPYSLNPERLALWHASAVGVWEHMEACETGAAPITENATHRTVFGTCGYYDACLRLNRDENLMAQEYLFLPRS